MIINFKRNLNNIDIKRTLYYLKSFGVALF